MSKKTLVLGASLKPQRYSNIAVKRPRKYSHEVVAFGLRAGEVSDVSIDTELIAYKDIDTPSNLQLSELAPLPPVSLITHLSAS